MIRTGYKLFFILPLSSGTKRVLLLDLEASDLAKKLSRAGMEVVTGTSGEIRPSVPHGGPDGSGHAAVSAPKPGGRFDIVVAPLPFGSGAPSGRAGSLGDLLEPSGHLVTILLNRLSYRELGRNIRGIGRSGRGDAAAESGRVRRTTLRGTLSDLRKAGFGLHEVYSPIPSLENPTVFVPLGSPDSMRFLLTQFPDFSEKKPVFVELLMNLAIGAGVYRNMLDQYVVISRRDLPGKGKA